MPGLTWVNWSLGTNNTSRVIETDGATTWVVVEMQGIVTRSTDSGQTWVRSTAIDTGLMGPTQLYYTGSVFLLNIQPSSGARRLYSSPDGVTWTRLADITIWGKRKGEFGIDGGFLYTITNSLTKTADGVTFTDIEATLPGGGYASYISAGGGFVVATPWDSSSIYWSSDGGATWATATSSLSYSEGVYYLKHRDVFINITGAGLSRSADGGATWSAFALGGLPTSGGNLNVSSIVDTPAGTLVSISAADSALDTGVWFSEDDGVSWTRDNTGTSVGTLYASNTQVVFSNGGTGTDEYSAALATVPEPAFQEVSDGFVTFTVSYEQDTYVPFSEELSTITLSDAIEDFQLVLVSDTVRFSVAVSEEREFGAVTAVRVSDAVSQAVAVNVSSIFSVTDATESSTDQTLVDVVSITDQRESASTATITIQDTVGFSSATVSITAQLVESTISFTDAYSQSADQTLEDTLTLSDDLSDGTLLADDELASHFTLSDAHEIQRISQHNIVEQITFTDTYFHKEPGAIAWVMNTETAAPSWYSNWQFVDMVQVGNKVLAVGPEGLVELGAGTDAGEDIDAVLGYGFSELGGYDRRGNPAPDPQKKRVDSFWFGYTSDDVLEVSVETLGQPVYTYSMEARNAEQARNNRIRPGKGLNARYWRVAITNVGGCEFDVDSIGADVVPTSRRL